MSGWEGEGEPRWAFPQKNPDHRQESTAGRSTHKTPYVCLPCLGHWPNHFKLEGGLQKPCPAETPARGGRQGWPQTCLWRRDRALCGLRASHYQLPAGWFCDVASEPGGHEGKCPGRSNETRAVWELNYPTNIPQTGSKRTNPSRNVQIHKVKSSRRPWNVDKSSEKQNVANSSRRALEGCARSGRLPKPAEQSLGDSLTLAPSPQPLRGSSR